MHKSMQEVSKENQLKKTEKLENVTLKIYQGTDRSGELTQAISGTVKAAILSELYVNNEKRIQDKDNRIAFLENEIARLNIKEKIPFTDISNEVKVLFKGLERFGYSKRINTNFLTTDTIAVFNVLWRDDIRERDRKANNKRLEDLLKVRMKLDTLLVIESP